MGREAFDKRLIVSVCFRGRGLAHGVAYVSFTIPLGPYDMLVEVYTLLTTMVLTKSVKSDV